MRIIILVVLALLSQFALANNGNLIQHTVSVTGEGFVDVEPDIVDLSFTLTSLEPTMPEAKQQVDDLYTQALTVLQRFKVDKKDITLTLLNSRPEYEWRDREKIFIGHRVSRSLKVTVRKIEVYPELLQALVEANISQVNQVMPRLADESAVKRSALKKAVSAAKRKADFLAIEFDRSLGKVIQVNEGGVQIPRPVIYTEKARDTLSTAQASNPPAMFGTQRVQATITAVFVLQ